MNIDDDTVLQLLEDLEIDRSIKEAHELLDLKRDNKWSIRLLLLSYLLKESELQTISEFVDFAFSKVANDSLFQRFDFPRISSVLAMPDKWFQNEIEDQYITGSKNARSEIRKRPELFTKLESGYKLNRRSGSRKIALVLYALLLKPYRIDLSKILERIAKEDDSLPRELYKQLFLLEDTGIPTPLFYEVQEIIETYPILEQESDFDRDTKSILPHIRTALFDLLEQHE
ncbi:MAG: hypothetical protein ACW96M_07890, partial [Candidatus Thorarchaeota archaeon]